MPAFRYGSPRVRLTAAEAGHRSKVELLIDDQWLDISSICTGFDAKTDVGEVSSATLRVLFADVATPEDEPIRLDAESLQRLARFVDEMRSRGKIE